MVIPAYAGALNTKDKRETALITGASSGIGLDLARLMAPDFDLIITARNKTKLEQIAQDLQNKNGNLVHVVPADLERPEAPEQIYGEIKRRGLRVDVLVNNAGFGACSFFTELSVQEQLAMIQVNITALTHLTRLVLPEMQERNRGRILNVASTAGFLAGPFMAVYYATKAYVISFSEAIANELKGTGIAISCLCPGATATEFAARARMEKSRLFKMGAMQSVKVARAAYLTLLLGRSGLVIPGVMNKLLVQSLRISPRRLVTAIARRLQETGK